MSIQDDIFDVEDALKRKPEAKSFERITDYLARVEEEAEIHGKLINDLRTGFQALQIILKGP